MALTQKEISQLYVALLNRAADAGGVEFWQDQASLAEAAQAMIDSQAGTSFYPEDNRAFVEQIYENTVGLEGQEDADIQYWVDLLASGEYSRGELVAHMVNSIMDSEYEGTPYQESFVSRVAVSEHVAGLNLAGMSPEELVAATTFDEDGLGVVRTEADTASAKEKAGELEAVDNTSLTEALVALEKANADLKEFLEGIDADEDGVQDYADVVALKAAVGAAETAVGLAGYVGASDAVKAQLIAAEQARLDNAQALNQIKLDEAQAKVDAVKGLSAAVAALEDADANLVTATQAQTDAGNAQTVAEATANAAVNVASGGINAAIAAGVATVTPAAAGGLTAAAYTLTKVDGVSGLVSLTDPAKDNVKSGSPLTDAKEIAAVKALQAELAEFITAFNAKVNADNAVIAATTAQTNAQAVVDHLDISAAAATELAKVGAGFTKTTPADKNLPTYEEVQAEIRALIADAGSKYGTFKVIADALDKGDNTSGAINTYTSTSSTYSALVVVEDTDGTIKEITATVGSTPGSKVIILDSNGKLIVNDTVVTVPADVTDLADVLAAANQYNDTIVPAVEALQAAYNFASTATAASIGAGAEIDLTDAIKFLVTDNSLVDATVTGLYDAFNTANSANALTAKLDAAKKAIFNDQGNTDPSDDTGSQVDLDAFAELLATEKELQDLLAQAQKYVDAIDAAKAAFGDMEFGAPIDLDTAKTYYGTSANDLFIVDPEVASTVSLFGTQGEDTLYIGTAHTVNMTKLAATTDKTAGEYTLQDAGDATVLEVFFEQSGSNLLLHFENEIYGANTSTGMTPGSDMTTVTLVGVTLDQVTIADGILTIA